MADVSGCWDHVNGATGIGGVADVVGAAETDGIVPIAVPIADMEGVGEKTVTAGVPGVICPVGVAQVRTAPGIDGSDAGGLAERGCVLGSREWNVGQCRPRPGSRSGTLADGSRAGEENARHGEDSVHFPRGSF